MFSPTMSHSRGFLLYQNTKKHRSPTMEYPHDLCHCPCSNIIDFSRACALESCRWQNAGVPGEGRATVETFDVTCGHRVHSGQRTWHHRDQTGRPLPATQSQGLVDQTKLILYFFLPQIFWTRAVFDSNVFGNMTLTRLGQMATKPRWRIVTSSLPTWMSTVTNQKNLDLRWIAPNAGAPSLAPVGLGASRIFRDATIAMWCGKLLCCANLGTPCFFTCLPNIPSSHRYRGRIDMLNAS